jgi:hypothetical protein
MITHTVVRYTVKPGLEEQNADLVRAVYRELAEAQPAGFEYATYRLEDGRTFVHVAAHDDDFEFPLRDLASFREFRAGLDGRCEQGPVVSPAEKLGGYGSAPGPRARGAIEG